MKNQIKIPRIVKVVLLMIYYVEFDLNEENFDKKLNMLWSLSFLLWKETMGAVN